MPTRWSSTSGRHSTWSGILVFADHYGYTRSGLEKLLANLPVQTALLTTEKDWVKLDALLTPAERATWPLYYLPVAMQFLPGQEQLFGALLDGNALKYR